MTKLTKPASESFYRRRQRQSANEKSDEDELSPPPTPPPPPSAAIPSESLDRRHKRQSELKEKCDEEDLPPPPPPPSSATSPPRIRDKDLRDRDRGDDRPHKRQSELKKKSDEEELPPPPPPSSATSPPRIKDRDRGDSREIDTDRLPLAQGGSNRSPSPPMERDRPREYKRQLTPRMRSAPPDGLRRSRGYGPDDRRFDYDYAGRYKRGGVGGRSGYAEEHPHGRYINSSSGVYHSRPPDWDSGRDAYKDVGNATGNLQRGGLMSFKQAIQEFEDILPAEAKHRGGLMSFKQFIQEFDILPAEAENRYRAYRTEYIFTQKRVYFDTHKDEEWLKNKYHPTNLLTVIERSNERARKRAKEFMLDLQSRQLDLSPGVTAASSGKSGQASDPNSEDEGDGGSKRRHGRGPAKENDYSSAPKAHPISSEPRHINADIELAQDLVCKLDKEKGIQGNILCNKDQYRIYNEKIPGGSRSQSVLIWNELGGVSDILEGTVLLDSLLTYLWRIHGVDYYGMIETNEAKGLRHVRQNNEVNTDEIGWAMMLNSFWEARLRGHGPLEIMTHKEEIKITTARFLAPHVRKTRDKEYGLIYGCGAKDCGKQFIDTEFVHKHLKLKHAELLTERTSKFLEDLYRQNYMDDPDAPGEIPIMQQCLQKEKPLRRRPMSPSRDFPSKTDDSGLNLDDPLYDAYSGEGMHAAPAFSSDMPPPPLLMPKPGAGYQDLDALEDEVTATDYGVQV